MAYNKDDELTQQIAKRMKRLREQNNWSKTYVAKQIGIKNLGTYANYEYGIRRPSEEYLLKLADLYNISIDFLLGNTPESTNNSVKITSTNDLKEFLDQNEDHLYYNGKKITSFEAKQLMLAIKIIFEAYTY